MKENFYELRHRQLQTVYTVLNLDYLKCYGMPSPRSKGEVLLATSHTQLQTVYTVLNMDYLMYYGMPSSRRKGEVLLATSHTQ